MGGSLTSQKRGRDTILRSKPVPTDHYSLRQAYQRWDYRDFAYLWTLLPNSEKQVYRTKASRYHITGFSQFMRENLKDLPNILARFRLDNTTGGIAYDSSKYARHGTVTGATPITGVIDKGLSFDGINDYIGLGTEINLGITDFSIEFWIKTTVNGTVTFSKFQNAANRWRIQIGLWVAGSPTMWCTAAGVAAVFKFEGTRDLTDGLWHHVVMLGDRGNRGWVYVDGVDDSGANQICLANDSDNTGPLHIAEKGGIHHAQSIDNLIIYDRLLDETEIKRHSQRRYPA